GLAEERLSAWTVRHPARGGDVPLRRRGRHERAAAEQSSRRRERPDLRGALPRRGRRRERDARRQRALRADQLRGRAGVALARQPGCEVEGRDRGQPAEPRVPLLPELTTMKAVRNERGVVMVVALGIVLALAGLSLTVARSGQMSTLTGALS